MNASVRSPGGKKNGGGGGGDGADAGVGEGVGGDGAGPRVAQPMPDRAERHPQRVQIALPPGAATLIGQPHKGGLAWAGSFPSMSAAIVYLIRRALSVDEEPLGGPPQGPG